MLVLHDSNGVITGLQTFPETSIHPHIEVSENLFNSLENLIGTDFTLKKVDDEFQLPADFNVQLTAAIFCKSVSEKLIEIERQQILALKQGVDFLFNATPDKIQTRSERDLINISGIATKAMLLKAKGVNQAVIEFRAESNASYMLTPDDAIALGEVVADHNQQIYSKAWMLKDAISAAQTLEELELLQW